MEEYASLLWIAAIAVIFWLLIIRPAQRRQKAMQQMQSGLNVGDDVLLTSGVYGTIAEITEDDLGIEVAPGVVLRVVRGAIGNKVERDALDQHDEVEATDAADEATDEATDEANPENGER